MSQWIRNEFQRAVFFRPCFRFYPLQWAKEGTLGGKKKKELRDTSLDRRTRRKIAAVTHAIAGRNAVCTFQGRDRATLSNPAGARIPRSAPLCTNAGADDVSPLRGGILNPVRKNERLGARGTGMLLKWNKILKKSKIKNCKTSFVALLRNKCRWDGGGEPNRQLCVIRQTTWRQLTKVSPRGKRRGGREKGIMTPMVEDPRVNKRSSRRKKKRGRTGAISPRR